MDFEYKNIEIASTPKTPYVGLNKDNGTIVIEGNSFPENAKDFYYQINRWLAEYSLNPAPKTTVNISLLYLNSSSVSVITGMMKLFDSMISMKTTIEIIWSFEAGDEDMKEMGMYYQDMLNCPVQIIEEDKFDF